MAVRLPTFEVGDTQGERIFAAFGGRDAYAAELRRWVLDRVQTIEMRALDEEANTRRQALLADLTETLPIVPTE